MAHNTFTLNGALEVTYIKKISLPQNVNYYSSS